MNILFITSNRVGDAVLSTGVLAWLEERYPNAQFTIACGPYAAGLFRAVPRLARLIVLEKKPWNRHWLELWQVCIGTRWNLIVDFRNSIVSHLLRAEKRLSPPHNTGKHKVVENAASLNPSPASREREGPIAQRWEGEGLPAPRLWLDDKAEKEAERLLPATRPLLALAPGANWPCKQWPVERFAELAKKLTAEGEPLPDAPAIVIADKHEREQIRPLLQSIPSNRLIEITGRDLLTVAAALRQCRLFVGNDSGLMHVAAAMGTPTLGLFGPGYEEIYGPWGPHCAVVRTDESREELLARIPDVSARGPNLMGGLSVEKAYEAAIGLLRKAAKD